MTPGELFDEIRAHYLQRFGDHIDNLIADGKTLAVEAAFRDAEGKPIAEGELGLPVRSDAVIIENGVPTESHVIQTESFLSFEPVEFDWDGLQVTIRPFRWEECEVTVDRGVATNYKPVGDWFRKWFFEEEDGDEESFLGAVHFLSDPTETEKLATLVLDFGSAPVEAVEEFLDAVLALPAKSVTLGGAA